MCFIWSVINPLKLFPVWNFFLLPLPSSTGSCRRSLHALSGWTACSSRMLLVRGQRPGSLNTPTTPFQQAGIPATINQSGDGPWMSVNMFPSLTPSPNTFLPCSFSVELFLSFTLNCSCFHLHDHLESVSRLIKDLGVIIDLGLGDKNS